MASDGRRNGESSLVCKVNGVCMGVKGVEEEEAEESKALLPSGGCNGRGQDGEEIGKRPKCTKRKVQWNDDNGNKLVEILEFEPSETSDSDDDDDYVDSCICTVM